MPILESLEPLRAETVKVLRWLRRGNLEPAWGNWDELADSMGLPRKWVVCPHCGQQGWRFPPHAFDPCPMITQMAEATGLKLDADRSATIRMGVASEEMLRLMREQIGDDE